MTISREALDKMDAASRAFADLIKEIYRSDNLGEQDRMRTVILLTRIEKFLETHPILDDDQYQVILEDVREWLYS